jgi:superfamily II helicase
MVLYERGELMGILDNFEAYLEKAENTESCHFCQGRAKYNDVVELDQSTYDVVGVCERHSFKGLSS